VTLFAHFPVRESVHERRAGEWAADVVRADCRSSAYIRSTHSNKFHVELSTLACNAPSRTWPGGLLLLLANEFHCSVEDEGGVFQG
jgi:hypothetical protein